MTFDPLQTYTVQSQPSGSLRIFIDRTAAEAMDLTGGEKLLCLTDGEVLVYVPRPKEVAQHEA